MSGIWAKSVLASRHAVTGARLDTLLIRAPRILLAEMNTHRAISKNTASSRAIPIAKMIDQVMNDPFVPEVWTKNQPGMQGYELLSEALEEQAQTRWLLARDEAVRQAEWMVEIGCHKQIVNRLLEPFMWTLACWSGTEWDNFFALRDHPAAEPHIQILAKAIRKARDEAEVQVLEPGDWHLPFADGSDNWNMVRYHEGSAGLDWAGILERVKVLSVARCASTSYLTVEGGEMTLERAQKIYDSLSGPPLHASPYEHVAQADHVMSADFPSDGPMYVSEHDHRNFIGFRQLRAQIERGGA